MLSNNQNIINSDNFLHSASTVNHKYIKDFLLFSRQSWKQKLSKQNDLASRMIVTTKHPTISKMVSTYPKHLIYSVYYPCSYISICVPAEGNCRTLHIHIQGNHFRNWLRRKTFSIIDHMHSAQDVFLIRSFSISCTDLQNDFSFLYD